MSGQQFYAFDDDDVDDPWALRPAGANALTDSDGNSIVIHQSSATATAPTFINPKQTLWRPMANTTTTTKAMKAQIASGSVAGSSLLAPTSTTPGTMTTSPNHTPTWKAIDPIFELTGGHVRQYADESIELGAPRFVPAFGRWNVQVEFATTTSSKTVRNRRVSYVKLRFGVECHNPKKNVERGLRPKPSPVSGLDGEMDPVTLTRNLRHTDPLHTTVESNYVSTILTLNGTQALLMEWLVVMAGLPSWWTFPELTFGDVADLPHEASIEVGGV